VQVGVVPPPEVCAVCADERQYVGWEGQQWTTLVELRAAGHRGDVREEAPGLYGVGTTPSFAIGQRAMLVPGEGGNLLWDCVSYLDASTVSAIERLGGIAAIAISHPHFYGAMVQWSAAFGDVPIYVHAADASWVQRRGNVVLWSGDTAEPLPGRTLINCGVHFAGGTVLHWPGPAGRGALASGDIFMVVSDRRWVSFMYSYPNLIPEHPETIARAIDLVEPYAFDAIYGAWWGRVVTADAKAALRRSAARYRHHLGLS
jgi:hypothetical protein